MNILLLTYSFNYNYGGLLQAYATVKYLESQGHSVTVPKSHPAYLVGNTSLFRGLGLRRRNPITAILRRLRQVERYKRFDSFRSQLPIDASLSSKDAIKRDISRFEAVLTGSDQTWNTKFMPSYEPYFYQGFIAEGPLKVSYASCFGTRQQKDEILSQAAKDLGRFDFIAVRNEVSREIVERLTQKNPTVVVDPTLLHDFNEFRTSAEGNQRPPFIMVYALDIDNFAVAESIVREVQQRQPDIEVHFINGEKNFDKPHWATHLVNSYGPKEFLASMQEASLIVTDSFHGLIFAQKFAKPCIGYSSGWRSERIVSIMSDFGATELLLLDDNPTSVKSVVAKVMDMGARLELGATLQAKINASKSYLANALSEA
ncbi:polysaccharide pyruvyl transferase family protein [Stenotrophomonas sp. CFBP 13725]|uniref:polysaccharide pyruvyl transferase family protein n=1 Tax=Stenotrophomonas sp. CFBP 13725 TaxID=2775297 RepID=UPI00177CF72F|nr:polysaccharide pyruvyl transferase family protein [Stenotrophomonas sp. CFBP 13725]MBD8637305.1 polysaccharide pyruvyl transferase family protein [Stenotrophomonas sp. CFBP 13725]